VAGVVIAVPSAMGTIALARMASRMRTDGTPTRTDLVGRLGVIVTPIPVRGYGEVRISIGGQPVKLNAGLLIGSAVVIASGMYLFWRESRRIPVEEPDT